MAHSVCGIPYRLFKALFASKVSPIGTDNNKRALLITKFVNSPSFWFQHENADLLFQNYNDVIHTTIPMYNGQVINMVGNGFWITFPTCDQAISAALDIQIAICQIRSVANAPIFKPRSAVGMICHQPLEWKHVNTIDAMINLDGSDAIVTTDDVMLLHTPMAHTEYQAMGQYKLAGTSYTTWVWFIGKTLNLTASVAKPVRPMSFRMSHYTHIVVELLLCCPTSLMALCDKWEVKYTEADVCDRPVFLACHLAMRVVGQMERKSSVINFSTT